MNNLLNKEAVQRVKNKLKEFDNSLEVVVLDNSETTANDAAKNAVNIPIIATKFKAICEYSNIGEHRTTKNTPAVTMVAACINAETGVGPSMASGNQVCKKNCADFPIAPMNKNKQIIVIKLNLIPKKLISFCESSGTS